MMIDWTPLRQELAIWRREGRALPFWWRDDDAVEPTEALDQLTDLSTQAGVPVHLAVIPKFAGTALATRLRATPDVIPVVHGWAHQSHAEPGQKNSEFPQGRDAALLGSDLDAALDAFHGLFPNADRLMFVPPWNRICATAVGLLADRGINALSTFTPRDRVEAAPGVTLVNTHVDPIDWRGTRGLVDPADVVAHTVAQLQDRRKDCADAREPFGFLTHHLVHDRDIWEFSRQFLMEMRDADPTLYRHDTAA